MKRLKYILFAICILFFSLPVFSQDSLLINTYYRNSIYFNSPISLINKYRLKYEVRYNQGNAYVVSLTNYHYLFRGYAFGLEYKHYSYKSKRTKKLVYIKSAWGISHDDEYSDNKNTIVGSYMFLGAGIGQQVFLGKQKRFFLEFTEGLRSAITINGNNDLGNPFGGSFYIFGPGAILDLNINMGWRFTNSLALK